MPRKIGEENYSWKGDKVGYVALHDWVSLHKGKPQKCEHCGIEENRKYHWANISGEYKRDLNDWVRLCVPCHSKHDKQRRTEKQNSSLHLYFQNLANVLNAAGLDMRVVLKPEIEIPWSKDTIKDFLWRPIQKLQVGKKSTTELNKKEVGDIYETLNRHISEKFGMYVAFPNLEELTKQK